MLAGGACNCRLSTLLVVINFLEFFVCNSFINATTFKKHVFLSLNIYRSLGERKGLLIHIVKKVLISSLETFIDIDDGLNFD